jgi:hypothetical protein
VTKSLTRQNRQSAFIYYIDGLIEIDDSWGLIIGDAIHNLRCALDHLAWQLAIRHNKGIEPNNPHVIQFPVEPNKAKWPRHFFDAADSAKLEDLQPFHNDADTDALRLPHPLLMLKSLSDFDKHRAIEVTSTTVL